MERPTVACACVSFQRTSRAKNRAQKKVGGQGPCTTTTLILVGTTLYLIRVTPNPSRAFQQRRTYPVPFLQYSDWHKKDILEAHQSAAAIKAGLPHT